MLGEQFSNAQGDNRTSKIRAIMHNFPGRTEKAIATKLRANFPIIYYGRAQEEPQARAPIPDPDPPQEERGQNDEDEEEEGVTHTNTQNQEEEAETMPSNEPNTSTISVPTTLRDKFNALFTRARKQQARVKRIVGKPNAAIVAQIDQLLQTKIITIRASALNASNKHSYVKTAIYTAISLLSAENEKKPPSKPPAYVYTERKIKKLEAQLLKSKKLYEFSGNERYLPRAIKGQARELRKLKLTPSQFIHIGEETLSALREKADL